MQPDSTDSYETLMQFLYRAPIGLVQTDRDGAIEMLNPMSARYLMPLAPAGQLDNLFDVLATAAPGLRKMAARFEQDAGIVCEALHIDAPGDHGSLILSLSLLKLDDKRLMAALTDVTAETLRERQRLDTAARTDSLSRLANRQALREQLQYTLDNTGEGRHVAVVSINFDRFQRINEALGNAVGDQVIRLAADRLRLALRRRDGGGPCIARIAGDEFAVILDGMRGADDAAGVTERLQHALAQPYLINNVSVDCSTSAGIVMRADMAGAADDVLGDASLAVAMAKLAGGARQVVFSAEMRERAARRSGLEAEIRHAIVNGELFVVYQPVVGLLANGATDRSTGVEALVRWRHPSRGMVPPMEFIAIAEQCGMICAIGEFVLRQACTDFMGWQRALGPLAPRLLAVNLSRAQLAQPRWDRDVAGILEATGMPAAQLQLEVTESLAAQDAGVQQQLHALKALGLQLALDDFGTGYSSLSSLHLLPVDTVKVDRSFVSQADTSGHHRVLIDATVRVARSLGMRTVAEGIETPAQEAVVRELGCDKGQGYLFARPMPAADLAQWIGAHAAMPEAAAA
ncbi:MAG TPA: bifunctional diguanylate cyclase/phosphodiesterase [Burkholderiaceae bacterium]